MRALCMLRKKIAQLEGKLPDDTLMKVTPEDSTLAAPGKVLVEDHLYSFGISAVDQAFTQNAMPLHALHEIRAPGRSTAAASGFILAFLTRLSLERSGPIIWIATPDNRRETGNLYGPGLKQFGLNPDQLILVNTPRDKDALWAAEEALNLNETLAVILDIKASTKALTLTTSRRLHLRAETKGTPVFTLLTGSAQAHETIALTRWHFDSAPAGTINHFEEGIGYPAFNTTLTRNRQGQTGHWCLLWNNHYARFETKQSEASITNTLEAHSGSVVPISFNRSTGTT